MFFDLFSDFFDDAIKVFAPAQQTPFPKITCPTCHMTLERFAKSGKLGCSDCYGAFRPQMVQVLKSVHGNVTHTGKVPRNASEKIKIKRELDELKAKLDAAVAAERYEDAAVLRDRIRELSKKEGI